jgi:F-type H+-transporting ATPase subunit delta
MSSYRIASRYAKSLIDLATEQSKLDRVLEDMTYLGEVCKVRDVTLLLKSPVVKGDKKGKVLNAIMGGKIDSLTESFIQIILRKGRESNLPEIATEYINQYREIKGISIVEIVSAEALSTETLESIRKKLVDSKLTHSHVEFLTSIDPTLIGGFVVSFEDKLYDASVRHQLDLLRKQFTTGNYQLAN